MNSYKVDKKMILFINKHLLIMADIYLFNRKTDKPFNEKVDAIKEVQQIFPDITYTVFIDNISTFGVNPFIAEEENMNVVNVSAEKPPAVNNDFTPEKLYSLY